MYFPFLAEAAEFSGVALDALRQPLENGVIEIHRLGVVATFPARFQLILATNPCPCGNYGVRGAECVCPPAQIRRYAQRLSGPLRDRIDIDLHVTRVSAAGLGEGRGTLTSAQARAQVHAARALATERWKDTRHRVNAEVPGDVLRSARFRVDPAARALLDRALDRGTLTMRGYDRVLRVAWSIADLAGADSPTVEHIAHAVFLRQGVPS